MAYTLEGFYGDARDALKQNSGPAGREAVCAKLVQLLKEEAFIAEYCGPNAKPGIQMIYRCAETGSNLLVHIYEKGKTGPPHDHGKSWAIYGQAVGKTIMTTWKRLDDGSQTGKASLEKNKSFELNPGMAGTFEIGDVHSIQICDGSKFIRVTGTDLNAIDTAVFNPEAKTVTSGSRL